MDPKPAAGRHERNPRLEERLLRAGDGSVPAWSTPEARASCSRRAATWTTSPDYVRRFQRHQGLIRWDPAELADCRLDPAMARVLHVAALLEADTAITVQQGTSLGMTGASDLAVFLPQWDVEEAEHERALNALLAQQTYEQPARPPVTIDQRRHVLARVPLHAFGRVPHVSFLFCVLGAAAEYVATALYADLATRCDAPAVSRLLRDIARQEARHFAFFLAAARARGRVMSNVNGRVSRQVLAHLWEPIGVPTLGRSQWLHVFGDWLHDDHLLHRLATMDRVLDTIPHVAGARLMATFLDDLRGTGHIG